MGKPLCVTGATGYIGSWLVKCLLDQGHTVHATLRHPGDAAKTFHLLSLPGAKERLRLFKADLSKDGSFDAAINGCEGVFHLAMPLLFHSQNPQEDIFEPAIKGTINVLKACAKAKSVRRVVYTSSISTVSARDEEGKFKQSHVDVDETCWVSVDNVKDLKPNGWSKYQTLLNEVQVLDEHLKKARDGVKGAIAFKEKMNVLNKQNNTLRRIIKEHGLDPKILLKNKEDEDPILLSPGDAAKEDRQNLENINVAAKDLVQFGVIKDSSSVEIANPSAPSTHGSQLG